jgi:NTP pyrophosphatase (non-canonical NTP hydrolase)
MVQHIRDAYMKRNAYMLQGEFEASQVLMLAEEVGEFVAEYRRCIGMARRKGDINNLRKELADVVISAYANAAELGIDLDTEIEIKLEEIFSRGWSEAAHDGM